MIHEMCHFTQNNTEQTLLAKFIAPTNKVIISTIVGRTMDHPRISKSRNLIEYFDNFGLPGISWFVCDIVFIHW